MEPIVLNFDSAHPASAFADMVNELMGKRTIDKDHPSVLPKELQEWVKKNKLEVGTGYQGRPVYHGNFILDGSSTKETEVVIPDAKYSDFDISLTKNGYIKLTYRSDPNSSFAIKNFASIKFEDDRLTLAKDTEGKWMLDGKVPIKASEEIIKLPEQVTVVQPILTNPQRQNSGNNNTNPESQDRGKEVDSIVYLELKNISILSEVNQIISRAYFIPPNTKENDTINFYYLTDKGTYSVIKADTHGKNPVFDREIQIEEFTRILEEIPTMMNEGHDIKLITHDSAGKNAMKSGIVAWRDLGMKCIESSELLHREVKKTPDLTNPEKPHDLTPTELDNLNKNIDEIIGAGLHIGAKETGNTTPNDSIPSRSSRKR